MCNLYSITKGTQAIRQLLKTVNDLTNGFAPLPAVFPNKVAPVVRYGADGDYELVMMRWGFPTPPTLSGQQNKQPAHHQRQEHRQPRLDAMADEAAAALFGSGHQLCRPRQ
jgi:putative SOS response-associated peptidase YedK